jgi:anti-anti-sigma factor
MARMPLEESLTCVFQRVDGCVVLRLRGEMDLANAPQRAANLRLLVENDHVVGDLTGVSFMYSSGLNALIAGQNHAHNCRTSFRIAGAGKAVTQVLHLTGMDRYLHIHASVEDAIDAARAAHAAAAPDLSAPTYPEPTDPELDPAPA